jgi:hypothetical protein
LPSVSFLLLLNNIKQCSHRNLQTLQPAKYWVGDKASNLLKTQGYDMVLRGESFGTLQGSDDGYETNGEIKTSRQNWRNNENNLLH